MIERNNDLDKVINAIASAKQLTSNGKEIVLYITPKYQLKSFEVVELRGILKKLERDEKIFRITQSPTFIFGGYGFTIDPPFYILNLNDNFDDWVIDYQRQPSNPNILQTPKIVLPTEPVLEIIYTKNREIILNGIFLFGKPDFGGENDNVFDYLFKHPNKTYTKNEFEKELKTPLLKTFHKIIENLGFTGDLKKVFFSVSKDSILFKNPVKIKETGLNYLKLV